MAENIDTVSLYCNVCLLQVCPNAPLLSQSSGDGRSTATSDSTEATEEGEEEQTSFSSRLTSFQSLVFVKAFKEEKVMCQFLK